MRKALALILIGAALNAQAAQELRPCKSDPRIRCTMYDAEDVVELNLYVGYQTSIFFLEGEEIEDQVFGYREAWDYTPFKNKRGFSIKAKDMQPDTNLTVVTNKRTYNFDLKLRDERVKTAPGAKAATKNPEVAPNYIAAVHFRYKPEIKPMAAAATKSPEQKSRDVEKALEASNRKKSHNMDYWIQGAEELAPVSTYDNGSFTYFKFPPNMDLPSIYTVDPDGQESLVNKHMEHDQVVVEHVSRKFVLRRGKLVAAVTNDSYDPHGPENASKTIAKDVERKVVNPNPREELEAPPRLLPKGTKGIPVDEEDAKAN